MTRRILDFIAHVCLTRSRLILLIAGMVGAIGLVGAMRLRFDPDILNLVPQHNKEINDFRKVLEEMGTIDYHIVVLELPEGHDITQYEELIGSIAAGYEHSPHIDEVDYRIPNPIDLIDEILPHALLFLSPAELDRVAELLTDEGIRDSVATNRAMLRTPQATAMKDLVLYDPFRLLPIYAGKLRRSGAGFSIDASSGYYLSEDGRMVLILTKPKRAAQDIPFAQALMAEATTIEQRALEEIREAHPDLPAPEIGYTGGYAIAFADEQLIRNDIIANVLFSFFGVLAVFLYGFRRVASIGYAGLPMALALALTFGLAGFAYGELSSASAGFAALLAGLGIDFIMVTYGRYVDERNRGESREEAIRTLMHHTLPGVLVAAVTTSITFYAFVATDFRGMTQLGFLTGTGILFFLLAVVFVLPALIVQSEHGRSGRAPRLFHHSFGSERLIEWSMRHQRAVIVFWIICTIVSALLATRLRFSDNIQDLRARGNPGMLLQERLTERLGQSFDFMMWVNEAPTVEEALERTHRAANLLDPLVERGVIASYQSISSYLPAESRQREVIEILQRERSDRFSPDRIERTFEAALVENGFRPEAYGHYLELFRRALTVETTISVEQIEDETIAKLLTRFLKKTSNGHASVIYLYPAGGTWGRDVPAPLLAAAQKQPEAILTGVNLASGVLRGIVRQDAIRATTLGSIAVFIVIFLTFRSLSLTLLSFAPFVAGSTGMLGLMALFDLELNFMNVFVGLMIIGVATDYGIYTLQRFLEAPGEFEIHATEVGKAVVMAAITSIVGYGSFALSHYPGLRSIGYAAIFGVGLTGLASITLLPALLIRRRRKNEGRVKGEG
ncbi:MAG TPA: MMPL family transporter [Thermoanaerobaculia bacterium]|nr:MMPL family transporter [Thermoanaerobaculia bacterium]